jgi:hypothetical protein
MYNNLVTSHSSQRVDVDAGDIVGLSATRGDSEL